MKLTYDPELNIAYLRFKTKRGKVRTICVSDELNVDIAPDGSIYGLELFNANQQLGIQRAKKLILENETSGESLELAVG